MGDSYEPMAETAPGDEDSGGQYEDSHEPTAEAALSCLQFDISSDPEEAEVKKRKTKRKKSRRLTPIVPERTAEDDLLAALAAAEAEEISEEECIFLSVARDQLVQGQLTTDDIVKLTALVRQHLLVQRRGGGDVGCWA